MEFRYPKYNSHGDIDLEIKHPSLGWIPFTASKDDPEEFGRLLFEEVKNSEVEEYDPGPTVEPVREVPQSLTPLEARLGLRQWGIGREQIAQFFDTFKVPIEKEIAQDAWEYATSIDRNSSLILGFAQYLNKTEADIDEFFIANKGRTP